MTTSATSGHRIPRRGEVIRYAQDDDSFTVRDSSSPPEFTEDHLEVAQRYMRENPRASWDEVRQYAMTGKAQRGEQPHEAVDRKRSELIVRINKLPVQSAQRQRLLAELGQLVIGGEKARHGDTSQRHADVPSVDNGIDSPHQRNNDLPARDQPSPAADAPMALARPWERPLPDAKGYRYDRAAGHLVPVE